MPHGGHVSKAKGFHDATHTSRNSCHSSDMSFSDCQSRGADPTFLPLGPWVVSRPGRAHLFPVALWHTSSPLVSVLGFEEYTNGNKRQNKQTQSVILTEIFVPFTISDR
jgi:hypothetical protein